MTDCKPCESTAVQITKLILKFLERHLSLAKKILTLAMWGFVIFCIGLGAGMVAYFIKTFL